MKRPSTLYELNKEYIDDNKAAKELENSIYNIRSNKNQDTETLISNINELMRLNQKYKLVDQNDLVVSDVIDLCNQYTMCVTSIKKYQSALNAKALGHKEVEEVVKEQQKFDNIKKRFRNNYDINSQEIIDDIIVKCLSALYEKKKQGLEAYKQQARDIMNSEPILLKKDDPINKNDTLPTKLIVAKTTVHKTDLELLKVIGVSFDQESIYSDIQGNGNIWLDYVRSDSSAADIDRFVISYITKYIESFPLGAVHVSIVDKNPSAAYNAMINAFQSDANGDNARDTVQVFDKLKTVTDKCKQHGVDIFKKFKSSDQTLFDIYNTDKSDYFELIVLKGGIKDRDYSASDIQDDIRALTKAKERAHRSGIRFLIINEVKTEERERSKERMLEEEIKKNCGMVLSYNNGTFEYNKEKVECLKIYGDVETYVRFRTPKLAEMINKMKKDLVEIKDISYTSTSFNDDIMFIPVGKSGVDTVELPFSCNNSVSSTEAGCIGYMVIGASGYGKSSLFHSIVINGCLKHSPNDLNFWLLDFKDGSASSKYESGIPHIKYIASRNKVEDADCLFQMVLEEMTRRTDAFNKIGVNNIVEYNKKSPDQLPRIIIIIDEIQEIFLDVSGEYNYNESIKNKIASISSRMRSAGMHFVMIAQNLSIGRSNVLQEAFMLSASGRICFRVDQDALTGSGFKQAFRDHQEEIANLKSGEVYISYNNGGSIRKAKISFASADEFGEYLKEIREKYPNQRNTKVIGSETRLSLTDKLQGRSETYYDVISHARNRSDRFASVIGEDIYRMEPIGVDFSTDRNSSLLFVGTNKRISASLCSSVAISVSKLNADVYTFNANRDQLFMTVRKALENPVQSCKPIEFSGVIGKLYSVFIERQNELQYLDDDETPDYSPIFLIVNDYYEIESVKKNEQITLNGTDNHPDQEDPGRMTFDLNFSNDMQNEDPQEKYPVQELVSILLNEGYKTNIHVVLSISSVLTRGYGDDLMAAEMILFNDCDLDQLPINHDRRLKGLLESIHMPSGDETLAIRVSSGGRFSKIRPLIYDNDDVKKIGSL
ncbi:MAG: hypothetical protein IJ746_04410 [Ruminococcus sp.]|nr:hypothetical protein [Ruminococcus sp.]